MSEYIVEIENLDVILNQTKVINDICLKIEEGDFLILFGDDDAGKTTLINALMGFAKIANGSAQIWGEKIEELSLKKKNEIRFVPDDIIMEPEMTAEEYFQFMSAGVSNYNYKMEERYCNQFSINREEMLLDMTYQENKLVAIIAAMCAQPSLLILDEPYNFLEKRVMKELLQELEKLNCKGTCIILAVEKYAHAMEYGNRYVYLDEGTVKGEGEITVFNTQMKAVSLSKELFSGLEKQLGDVIGIHKNTIVYRYTGNLQQLLILLQKLQCQNFVIEEITIKEQLDEDYSRWE